MYIGTFGQISPDTLSRHINNQESPGNEEPRDCPENPDTQFCQLSFAYFQLPCTNCPLPIAQYRLQMANW